jgi:hypothetical protein
MRPTALAAALALAAWGQTERSPTSAPPPVRMQVGSGPVQDCDSTGCTPELPALAPPTQTQIPCILTQAAPEPTDATRKLGIKGLALYEVRISNLCAAVRTVGGAQVLMSLQGLPGVDAATASGVLSGFATMSKAAVVSRILGFLAGAATLGMAARGVKTGTTEITGSAAGLFTFGAQYLGRSPTIPQLSTIIAKLCGPTVSLAAAGTSASGQSSSADCLILAAALPNAPVITGNIP